MMFEIVILLEIIAFVFLALGILPYKGDEVTGKVPLLNKLIFVFVACTTFFILGVTSVSYEYNYCYVNGTTVDYNINSTFNTATCGAYPVENIGLSYFNWAMGILSITIGIIIAIFAIAFRHDEARVGDYDA